MEEQLKSLLKDKKCFQHLTNRDIEALLRSKTVNDVTTSKLYKELVTLHSFSGSDISLTWNTDGVPLFSSSNYSIWPLQASVNELPIHLRVKNMLLIGLWFGRKPCMNTFLKPFVDESSKLENEGFLFSNEDKPRKVVQLIFCGDAPARALVRNVKQFNGQYGCDWCESPGIAVENGNGPPVRCYPHRTPVVMRTARNQAKYALKASPKNPVKGVKGVATVDLLPVFNPVRGVAAD